MATVNAPRDYDPAKVRAGVRRTVWICVAVIVILLGLFLIEHL
ncbi:MAG TPA: hypothetical protein VF269_06350 [Rhodanobacteraceae bacterium]